MNSSPLLRRPRRAHWLPVAPRRTVPATAPAASTSSRRRSPGPGGSSRRRPRSGPGPSWRTPGRPRAASARPARRTARCTSRTWQAYSSGDHTSDDGPLGRVGLGEQLAPGAARGRAAAAAARSTSSALRVEPAVGALHPEHPGPVLGVGLDRDDLAGVRAHRGQSARPARLHAWGARRSVTPPSTTWPPSPRSTSTRRCTGIATFDAVGRPAEFWADKLAEPDPLLVAELEGPSAVSRTRRRTARGRRTTAPARCRSTWPRTRRGRGVGRALYGVLLDRLRAAGTHTALAVIALPERARACGCTSRSASCTAARSGRSAGSSAAGSTPGFWQLEL